MNKLNFSIKTLLLICSMSLLFASCKKDDVEGLGDAGQTIVKLPSDEGYNLIAMDLTNTAQDVSILEVRRDVHNEASLNSTMKVVIVQDDAVIDAYNTEHGTSYVPLPASVFTVDPSNPAVNGAYTVTFNPGEFYKTIKISVPDATQLDPAELYALGFKIQSVEGDGKASAELNETVVEVALKNKYDGHYKVTGSMVDLTSASLVGLYPFEMDLITVDASSVIMYHTGTPFTGYYHPILNGASVSAYGNYAPVFIFDPATNKIVGIDNGYGQGAGSRWAVLDPTGINAYDPATKTIRVKYFMNQPNATTIRTTFDETFTYMRPR